jgi:hypothetical protein
MMPTTLIKSPANQRMVEGSAMAPMEQNGNVCRHPKIQKIHRNITLNIIPRKEKKMEPVN